MTTDLSSLPCYWEEAAADHGGLVTGELPSLRELSHRLAAFVEGPDADAVPAVDVTPGPAAERRQETTTFVCMLPLPGSALAEAVAAWWEGAAAASEGDGSVVVVRRRLRLGAPVLRAAECGGWRLDGQLRRRGSWRWRPLAMTLELTPRLSYGTLLHLRPDRSVAARRWYFASGHRIVREVGEGLLRSAPGGAGCATLAGWTSST